MSIFATPITAWIPIRTPILDRNVLYEPYARARDALLQCIPEAFNQLDKELSLTSADVSSPPEETLLKIAKHALFPPPPLTEFIKIECQSSIDIEALESINEGRKFEDDLLESIAAIRMADAFQNLLLFSELFSPGEISTANGLILTSTQEHRIKEKAGFPELGRDLTSSGAWPTLSEIPPMKILEWVARTAFHTNALAITRIERALASYTHAVSLTRSRDGEVLFRAMQGLEAFYCDGTGDLRKQLSEKSALWLGPWADGKNIVGHLYDLRSKFIHGAGKIEFFGPNNDSWSEDEKYVEVFSEGVDFALRLLIATLQKCATENITDIQWSYTFATKG